MSDSFSTWFHATCPAAGPRNESFLAAVEAAQRGEEFRLLIGAAATRVGHAFLVHRFDGEYFTFELSERQARALDAIDPKIRFFPERSRVPSKEPRVCHLEKVEFVQTDSVDLTQPIEGTCVCRFEGPSRRDVCLHLETVLRFAAKPDQGRVATLDTYPIFSPNGSAGFEFKPLTSKEFARGQFVDAFLTVCTPPDSRRGVAGQAISNAAGVLVTVG